MSETASKVKRYAMIAAVALALGLVLGIAIPEAWRATILQGGGGLGLLALLAGFWPPKKAGKEGADAPKTKSDILADDPQHSVDRLPSDAKDRLDANAKRDADAQADRIFAKHRNDKPNP